MNPIDPLAVSQMGITEVLALIPKMKPGWFPEGVRKKTREYSLQEAPDEATLIGEMTESQRVVLYLEAAIIMGLRQQILNVLGAEEDLTHTEFLGYVDLLLPHERREFDRIVMKSRKYRSLHLIIVDQMMRETFGSQIPDDYAPMVCRRFEVFSVPACPCCGVPQVICQEEPDDGLLPSAFE